MHHLGFVRWAVFLAGLIIAGRGCSDSFAQGSTGGVIGKEDKSVSGTGSSEPERPARRSKPESETRRAPVRGSGGSVSRFEGGWTFVAAGCSAGTLPGVISGGKLSVRGGGGQVSASGALRATFIIYGLATVTVGRLSGVTGAGTYSRADGCAGRWTAIKQ
jgi:hypothetical protein